MCPHSMGITPASASAMQQAQVGAQIATAVMSKSADVVEQQGEAMVSLIEEAADLQHDITHDIPVDGQAHKGQTLDVRV